MKTGNKNLPRGKIGISLENETPGARWEIPKGGLRKYGAAARKIEIEAIGKHGAMGAFLVLMRQYGVLNRRKIFSHAVGNKPI